MLYLVSIVDIVDQQSKPSMRHIVASVWPKHHILLTVVHLAFKIATFVTHSMDRINIYIGTGQAKEGEQVHRRNHL